MENNIPQKVSGAPKHLEHTIQTDGMPIEAELGEPIFDFSNFSLRPPYSRTSSLDQELPA
jgi:hypothetical protein